MPVHSPGTLYGGAANNGWSASVNDSTNFGNVNNNGTPNNNNANNSYVPVLGFQAGRGIRMSKPMGAETALAHLL